MATEVNISVDQNNDVIVTLSPTIPGDYLGLMMVLFNNNDSACLLASQNLGGIAGDIYIESGAYKFNIKKEYARLLLTSGVTYKFWKVFKEDPAELIYYGAVSVTPLGGSPPVLERTSMDSPLELSGASPNADCSIANNFYVVLENPQTIYFTKFDDGAIKTVLVMDANEVAENPGFACFGATIKWPGGAQPTHPLGTDVLYSFQRFGDFIYVAVSDSY